MIAAAAAAAGVLFAAGIYLLLGRSSQRVVLGFLLMSNGANLAVLCAGGLPRGASAPLAGLPGPHADPLPAAFILTAIVIGLAAAGLLLAIAVRARRERGTEEMGDEGRRPAREGRA